MNSTKKIKYLGIIALTVLFFFNYNKIFDSKLDANGDNYSYYTLGESIYEGKGYKNAYNPQENLHGHFPPGYPFLISKMMIFSKSTDFIKAFNGFFLLASVLLLFWIFTENSSSTHVLIVALIGGFCLMNFHLLKSSTMMMSEIPFTFFSILSLFIFLKAENQKEKKIRLLLYTLLLTSVAITFYIRTTGVILFLVFTIYFLFYKKWIKSLIVVLLAVVVILPWQIRNKQNNIKSSYQAQLLSKDPYNPAEGKATASDFVDRFLTNSERYLSKEIVNGVFPFMPVSYKDADDKTNTYLFLGIILFIMAFIGLFFLKKNVGVFIFLYIAGTFSVTLMWPSQWFGTRFILPIIPILIFLIFTSFYELIKLLLLKFNIEKHIVLNLIFIVLSLIIFKNYSPKISELEQLAKKDYNPVVKDYIELAKFSKNNIDKDAVFCSRKSVMFYLHSGRKSVSYPYSLDDKVILDHFDNSNISYVVVDRLGFGSTPKYLIPAINKNMDKFQLIKQQGASQTLLFKYLNEKK